MSKHQGSSFWAATNYFCSLGKASSDHLSWAASCTSLQHLCLHTWAGGRDVCPSKGCQPKGRDTHSLCKGTGHHLLNMLMSSVRHNLHHPQTSGTSLQQCPSKIKSLTNSNQYFHYCIKLALFCFASNPNCFLSANWPAQGSDLNTICHCLPKPSQLTCLSLSTPGQGTESCHGFASSKPQNNIFNTVVPDRFLCCESLPWQT